jgi:2-dehydropantoate 2-reductase
VPAGPVNDGSVLVVGGGAIGGVAASLLAPHTSRLAVLDAHAEHVALMRDPGLRATIGGRDRIVPLDAHESVRELEGPFEFALVTVKAPNIDAAVRPLVESGLVLTYVSLGNGLVQDRVAAVAGADRVLVGVVEYGATNHGPGHVERTSLGAITTGEPNRPIGGRSRRLAEVIAPVAEIHLTDNILGAVWSKLLVNCTFSAVGAVSGLTTGEAISDPDGTRAALTLWEEGYEVARAQGLELEQVFATDPSELVASVVGREQATSTLLRLIEAVYDTKASMLQDLERGARTEVDVICGAVSAHGRATGVPTPANDFVVRAIHEIERGERPLDRSALAEAAAIGVD